MKLRFYGFLLILACAMLQHVEGTQVRLLARFAGYGATGGLMVGGARCLDHYGRYQELERDERRFDTVWRAKPSAKYYGAIMAKHAVFGAGFGMLGAYAKCGCASASIIINSVPSAQAAVLWGSLAPWFLCERPRYVLDKGVREFQSIKKIFQDEDSSPNKK